MNLVRQLSTILLASGMAALALGLSACSREPAVAAAGTAVAAAASVPVAEPLVVHEGPYCGCCGLWREHMEAAGFEVQVHKTQELGTVKAAAGVPRRLASCHTARIGGYFIEGHVPAAEVERLLAERPDAWGLAVAGMPAGAPGMEMPDGRVQPYEVLLVGLDGQASVYARYPRETGSCCPVEIEPGEADGT